MQKIFKIAPGPLGLRVNDTLRFQRYEKRMFNPYLFSYNIIFCIKMQQNYHVYVTV